MKKIIVYTQSNGKIALCLPTGELSIEEVLAKDCPAGSIIINDTELPQGEDVNYFDAWELANGQVIVNQTKKQEIINKQNLETITKNSALNKLNSLGLTQDELKTLIG
jgi:hypothetical protein